MVSGIYAIRHRKTGKMYIGSAVNIERRWYSHRSRLKAGTHHSLHLQSAWNKYGAEAFDFVIVEGVEDKAMLVPAEQFWMDFFEAHDRTKGYNANPVAGSALGVKRSVQTRARLSAAKRGVRRPDAAERMRGATRPPETRARIADALAKDWIVTDPNGQKMRVHNLYALCKRYGLNNGAMYRVASGKRRQYKGWRVKSLDDKERKD